MRKQTTWFVTAAVTAALAPLSASAHELWFHPRPEPSDSRASVRLTFGDSPEPGEAERVAEIARTKVWADGSPLEVRRLPNGLEATLSARGSAVLSAFADRGVIDYQGDSFVIFLAAYAQIRPLGASEAPSLGLGDDQLRLLLVARESGPPVVRATWKNEPVGDLAVQVFRRPGEAPTVVELSGKGEMPCPSLKDGPVSLLAVVMDKTPGNRDGKAYTHVRYKATLNLDLQGPATTSSSSAECLDRVREIHGEAGPWAVAGYRMGERAIRDLGLPRHSLSLLVLHRSPAEVQYSCMADGLQAATGASPGKLNLKVETVPADDLSTVIENRKTGRRLVFKLQPELVKAIDGLPPDRLEEQGRRVVGLPDDAIFTVTETPGGSK